MDYGWVIRRHELSDSEWEFVRPLLPRSERGQKRLDDRTVLNGIVWKFRTGTAWRNVPELYGSWATLHTRFRRWARDGTFERMLREAQTRVMRDVTAKNLHLEELGQFLKARRSELSPTASPPLKRR
ncbi:transposase [Streptomyces scopuliridis]|uniref:transposase n=1 Tax=Streptomyces scopuliridis TaxID=452529 RepID=UPI0036B506CE